MILQRELSISELVQIRSPVINLITEFSNMMKKEGLVLECEHSEIVKRLRLKTNKVPKLISRRMAQDLLGGITSNTLDFKIIPEANLTKYKVGGSIRLDENEILEYLERAKVKGGDDMDTA